MARTKDISFWLYAVFAFIPLILQITGYLKLKDIDLYKALFIGESGFIEVLTAVLLIVAGTYAIICGRYFLHVKLRIAAILLFVYALGCFIFMAEEISWGQQIFNWKTPEFFLLHNESQETNLHNLTGSNRKVLKGVLIGGIAFGGVILPLLAMIMRMAYRPVKHWIIWLIPTRVCIPVAIFLTISHAGIKYLRVNNIIDTSTIMGIRIPEVTELYIAFFFTFYAASIYKRMKQTDDLSAGNLVIGP